MSVPSQSQAVSAGLAEQEEQQRQVAQARLLVEGLNASVWAHAALTAAMEAGVLDLLLLRPMGTADLATRTGLDRMLLERMLDVLVALGLVRREGDAYALADGLAPVLRAPSAREASLATLRSQSLQSSALVQRARDHSLTPGWHFADPAILHAQGDGGVLLVQVIAEQLVPMLPGLRERLDAPTATFLDVGVGVGRIDIELCRRFPHLRAVGIDIQETPLHQAKRAVAVAGLADRIELRLQAVDELGDRDAFDLAWLPQSFVSGEGFARGLRAVYRALRPGGWLLLASLARDGSDLGAAVSRLIDTLWGGDARTAEQVAARTSEAGFTSVRILPTPPGEPITGLIAQRPK
jgi:SAM-dependent methyltransferase